MSEAPAVKFLLADDLEENLRALEALLRRDGLEMYTARNGAEALELLLVHDFALALLDVQMPGMDGFELAELMRGTERTRHVPIIFLTAVATDERRMFRGYSAGAVDFMFKPIDPQLLRTKAAVFFDLARHRQEIAAHRDELQASAQQLSDALDRLQAHRDNSPLALIEFDPDLCITSWSQGAERMFGWREAEAVGRTPVDLGWATEERAQAFRALWTGQRTAHAQTGRNARADGSPIDCEWYCTALYDDDGRLVSIQAQALDITERTRAQETQRLLIGELNHRVKNTLATVQAVATQTLRHSANPSAFAGAFSGRIQALARAHSLLSDATWRGAALAQLVQDQLRLGAIDEARLTVSGPDVRLPPQLALHFAMILHELVTNANKYGALASASGRIALSWTLDGETLRFSWTESGGGPVKAPSRRGFGTTLIEQSARAENGKAQIEWRADGLHWDICVELPDGARADAEADAKSAGADAVVTSLASAPSAPPGARLAGRRLLVVEDEPLVALELVTMLEDAGARVTAAAALAQALEAADAGDFDGALLDGNLHGQPVDAVAAVLTRRKIPFVFISGYGQESLPRAFAHAPNLMKPFSQRQVLDAVARLAAPAADVIQLRK